MNIEFTRTEIKTINQITDRALEEDIGTGDITTNHLIADTIKKTAVIKAKENGIIAGLFIAKMVFEKLDPDFKWHPSVEEGEKVKKGDILVKMEGTYRTLLTAERTALNFLQRMSGIATASYQLVDKIKNYKTKILDTRKTAPGLRLLDKYAVKTGGGKNHRIGLYDMALIKENHIRMAGSISLAVNQIRSKIPSNIKIEVETTQLLEVKEALESQADIIMLDNMTNTEMTKAVKLIDGKAQTEASGNITSERVEEIAKIGVDFISVGALTHSPKALDLSQIIECPPSIPPQK